MGDNMGAFAIIGIIYIIFKLIQEAYESSRPYESGSIENSRKFSRDVTKVSIGEISSKELDKRIRRGDYR